MKAGTHNHRPALVARCCSSLIPHLTSVVMGPGSRSRALVCPGRHGIIRHTSSPPAASSRPGCCVQLRPKTSGRGERRVRDAPAASRAKNKKHTSVVTAKCTGSPGAPAREWFYGFLRALPGDRAFLPPSPAQCVSIVTDLTPASGRQDHTTSPSAPSCVRLAHDKRPSHPAPAFATIAKRPLHAARDGTDSACDLGSRATLQSCDRLARRANHLAT